MKSFSSALLVFAIIALSAAKERKQDDKVKIAVYYEALCPDSKAFIVNQLAPVWSELRGTVKVKLVPYGKATHDKVNGIWQFTCQHGPDECFGNKIQSCILKSKNLTDTDKVDLIVCQMKQSGPDQYKQCFEGKKITSAISQAVMDCASSEQGSQLLATNGDKTNIVQKPLATVPTIVINEKYDLTVHTEAIANLKAVVCKNAVKKPSVCY